MRPHNEPKASINNKIAFTFSLVYMKKNYVHT